MSRENCVFCANKLVFKTFFGFSLKLLWLFIVFPNWTSLKPTEFLTKTFICSSFQLKSSSKKGMGFLFLTIYFMFFALFFLICELLLSIVIYGVSAIGWSILLSLFDWFLWGFIKWCSIYLFSWTCLCFENVIWLNLCYAVHFMLVVICLKVVTCFSGVFIVYIMPSYACTPHTHQCFLCLNVAFLTHLRHLCAISFYISMYTYFIN